MLLRINLVTQEEWAYFINDSVCDFNNQERKWSNLLISLISKRYDIWSLIVFIFLMMIFSLFDEDEKFFHQCFSIYKKFVASTLIIDCILFDVNAKAQSKNSWRLSTVWTLSSIWCTCNDCLFFVLRAFTFKDAKFSLMSWKHFYIAVSWVSINRNNFFKINVTAFVALKASSINKLLRWCFEETVDLAEFKEILVSLSILFTSIRSFSFSAAKYCEDIMCSFIIFSDIKFYYIVQCWLWFDVDAIWCQNRV